MLAVVELEAVPLERERRTAEPRAPLVEHDLRAAVGAGERRREAGEAAADDGHLHAPAPARLRARTSPFSHGRSESAAAEDERRLGRDPLEQPAVLPCHRENARAAAAVDQRHEVEACTQPSEPPLGLEGDHELDRALEPAVPGFAAEPLEVLARQIDTSVRDVLAHVPEDVPELERDSELVGERRGRACGRSSRRHRATGGRSSSRRTGSTPRARRTSRTRCRGRPSRRRRRARRRRRRGSGSEPRRRRGRRGRGPQPRLGVRAPPRISRELGELALGGPGRRRRRRRSAARARRRRRARCGAPAAAAACRRRSSTRRPGRRGGNGRRRGRRLSSSPCARR